MLYHSQNDFKVSVTEIHHLCSLLEKLAEHCTNGCQRSPCAALLEENQLQCPHSVSLVSVATMLAGLLPLPACHSDDMYLLTADQQNKDMENRTETCCMLQPAKWGSDCASSNCNSAFQELLIHLSLLHQILVSSSSFDIEFILFYSVKLDSFVTLFCLQSSLTEMSSK
jgi:hypothetical protein